MTAVESEGETLLGETIFRVKHVLLSHVEVVGDELSSGEMILQIGLVDGADQRLAEMEFVNLSKDPIKALFRIIVAIQRKIFSYAD